LAEVALKTCRVSCVELGGVEHAVEVTAGSLYEAVAQALRIFRDNDWIESIRYVGSSTRENPSERLLTPHRNHLSALNDPSLSVFSVPLLPDTQIRP